MITVGRIKRGDGTLVDIQVDETDSRRALKTQISVVLTKDYFPVQSGHAFRATWPTGGEPFRLTAGQCIMVTSAEAFALRNTGVAKLSDSDNDFFHLS